MKLSPDSLKLVQTPAFNQLLRELEPHLRRMEQVVSEEASTGKPYDSIRYRAGRLDGARYFLGMLKHAKEQGDAQTEQTRSEETGSD